MKKTHLLLLTLLFNSVLFAQSNFNLKNSIPSSFQHSEYFKQQVMQYRLINLYVEDYDLGLWEKTDSVYYVYDTELPYGHGNFDFLETSNFTSEPLYYLAEWLEKSGDVWEGYYKYYNNFNDDDQRTSTNIDYFDGVSYVGDSRAEYSYNDDGQVDSILFLDYTGGDYDPYYRYNYTYNDGNLANIVYQSYGADWENDLLIIYTFTASGLIDNIVYRSWDGIGWYDVYRYVFSYDGEGNITEKLVQSYDFGWETDGRYVYTYDGSGFNNLVEIQEFDGVDYSSIQKFDLVEFSDGLPSLNTVSYWDGFIWNATTRIHYDFESFDDGTVEIQNQNPATIFNLYPNPTTDQITFDFNSDGQQPVSLIISDAAGNIIERQTFIAISGNNKIQKQLNASLPSGLYTASLIIGGAKINSNFIVE